MSASAVARLEALCDDFEAAWRGGARPPVEEALAGLDPAERREALRELLVLELAYRARAGERPTLTDYRDRFPADADILADAFGAATTAGGPAAPPRGHLPTVAGFEVLGELGRGGMGIVYHARSLRLNRPVALKMILAGAYAGPEAAARFLAEAEAVARLQHPSIVQVFSLGDHEGLPYLEMEFASGGSLASTLDGLPRPAREAARLVETVARAVHHAHGQGIVHRDLKPANVLLAADGRPKVTDFGLAKLLDVDAGLTRTESVIGSPSYMAPEQAEGRHKDVGPASDVYSLGALFYELLTGRPPFRGATAIDTLVLVKTAEPTPPSRLAPVPRDAATVALACLRKEPGRRYESAEALADDLARFQAGEPIRARPVGPAERAWKWAARRPATAALAVACAVLLLLLGLANGRVAAPGLVAAAPELVTPSGVATSPRSPAPDPTAERPLTGDQYVRLLEAANRLRNGGDVAAAARLLETCPQARRGWEWHNLVCALRADTTVLRGHEGAVWDIAWSPDGALLASAGFGDNVVRTWDARANRPRLALRGHAERVYSVDFSPDGRRLVSASADRTAIIWDLAAAQPAHILRGHTENVRCAEFRPDGRLVATGSWDGTIRLWDAATGNAVGAWNAGVGRITRLAFSPDGRRLAVAGGAALAEVWDPETRTHVATFRGHAQHVLSVAWSPDGRHIASTSGLPDGQGGGSLQVWDADTGAPVGGGADLDSVVERVVFSPDGTRLATAGWDHTVTLWDTWALRPLFSLRGHDDRVWGLNFNPDGTRLASASGDGTVRIWDATPQH